MRGSCTRLLYPDRKYRGQKSLLLGFTEFEKDRRLSRKTKKVALLDVRSMLGVGAMERLYAAVGMDGA